MAYFPMFVNLEHKKCLVAGGGTVALRKVQVLRDFGAEITVVAPEIMDRIRQIPSVVCVEREFRKEDMEGCALVVAATNEKEENHRIASLASGEKIPVNAVDQVEDCSFIFPSYVKKRELVAAFSSGGQSPVMTQYLKESVLDILTDELGALSECLGSIREEVKASVAEESERKKVYREILSIGLSQETLPDREQMERVINQYRRKTAE